MNCPFCAASETIKHFKDADSWRVCCKPAYEIVMKTMADRIELPLIPTEGRFSVG